VTAQTFETWFPTQCPGVPLTGAAAVLKLSAEDATVPFIARYRKEQTGNLDEVAIQNTLDAKERWDDLLRRQAFIVEEIERQKKLTPELKETILSTFERARLEDLYLPFKSKRKSRATLAREAGIEPLADWVWNCGHGTDKPLEGQTLELWAFTFRNEEAGFKDLDAVLAGTLDILTERLCELPELRQFVRDTYFQKGVLRARKGEKVRPHSKYETYFEYSEKTPALMKPEHSHRYLAVRRGWLEGELALTMGGATDDAEFEARLLAPFEAAALTVPDSPGADLLRKAARAAIKGYVVPAIENEVHKALKDVADGAAITVFADNVRQLLLASPYGPKAVVGVDPGVRTGCKLAVVNDAGQFIASTTIKLRTDEEKEAGKKLLAEMLAKTEIRAIAVGNGTAGRETQAFVSAAVKEFGQTLPVVLVSEAGASVYSASATAREEFPEVDVSVRGAISIARRLQDPLAELVKIDPKSIGVGQYQHDVSQSWLKRSLDQVVDRCVNQVGVDLNTASTHLLAHVSGLGPALAKAIVERRAANGLFRTRQQLLEISRFTRKTFEQAAGFLRIPGGDYPLDNTAVHPERYALIEGLATRLGRGVGDLLGPGVEQVKAAADLREELGPYTFDDIVRELEKPGRDPRDAFVPFEYREDVHEVKDLKPGMVCPGIVTNVTNFGAFVDIGVHQDGLVHISQLAGRFVKDPRGAVKPGDRVQARVLAVDLDKKQISLSLKPELKPRPPRQARPARKRAPEKPAAPRAAKPAVGSLKPTAPSPTPRPEPRRAPRPPAVQSRPARPAPPPRPAKPAFNNPFAVLAQLKKPGQR
jgi:protein Tex